MIKSKPKYPFQERVRKYLIEHKPRVGCFVPYGGGKTYLALQWLQDLIDEGENPFPCIVLTKKALIAQWVDEIHKHSDFSVVPLVGNATQRLTALSQETQIYVCNYATIRSRLVLEGLGGFLWGNKCYYSPEKKIRNFQCIIADESTKLKKAGTQQFVAWYTVCSPTLTPYRLLLTGRPATEHVEEFWAQFYFLDGGETLGKSFWNFRKTYFNQNKWIKYKWTLKKGAIQKLATKMAKRSIYISEKEVSKELPPRYFITYKIKMPEKTRKVYRELKNNFTLTYPERIQKEDLQLKWAMTKVQLLHQLCSGFVYDDETKEPIIYDTAKLDYLKDILPSIIDTGQLLIWHFFRIESRMIATILDQLHISYGRLSTDLSLADRQENLDTFKKGKTNVLILSETLGNAGLNLQNAKKALFFSLPYSAEIYGNALARNWRSGSEIHSQIDVYNLITSQSLDGIILRALKRKQDVTQAVLQYLQDTQSNDISLCPDDGI